MCDEDIHQGLSNDPTVSRRTFGLIAAAAAGIATTARAAVAVTEKDVDIRTPDGTCDAALYYPSGAGTWPAVLIWTDIMSLRPAFREMGRRLAGEGYVVLVPNVYYRSAHAPVVSGTFNFGNPDDRAKIMPMRQAIDDAGLERDSAAYVAFLDAQSQTDRSKKMGVQGYCMGGPFSFYTAAWSSNRIGAVGSFHGGGLTTANDKSPHLLIPSTHADYVVCIAQNDDARDPASKDTLKAAFAAAGKRAKVEVYAADHGWCVPGSAVYNEAEAERAWGELLGLYRRTLA